MTSTCCRFVEIVPARVVDISCVELAIPIENSRTKTAKHAAGCCRFVSSAGLRFVVDLL
jgi:hypothetical protein